MGGSRPAPGSRGAVRLFFHDAAGSTFRRALTSLLQEAGLADPQHRDDEAAVGVLGFAGSPQDLPELVRRHNRGGTTRVLLVRDGGGPVDGQVWPWLAAGADDLVRWDRTEQSGDQVVRRLQHWLEVDRLLRSPTVQETLVGGSPVWRTVLREVVEVGAFSDLSVLVTGESGTGKELVARLIHSLDPREDKGDLVLLDCTTVVPSLSGSEFFGHEKGAFTGAAAARDGAFAMADGGTLFLDEVGELPLPLQAELLRVIQEGTYKRVGGNVWHRTRFRLVCATNRDLRAEESDGRFRKDLFYRLAAFTCRLPSLDERRDDVLPLSRHFLRKLLPDHPDPRFDDPVEQFLATRGYPGNVRELRHLVTLLARRHIGTGPLSVGAIPDQLRPGAGADRRPGTDLESSIERALDEGLGLKEITTRAREAAIGISLRRCAGNLQRAARLLGVTDRALQLHRAAGAKNGGRPVSGPVPAPAQPSE